MESHIDNCNTRKPPIQTVELGFDRDRVPSPEKWEYASIMGILMLIANNYRTDIAYAVKKCSR